MDNNVVFNATVCLIGFVIFSVHIANLLMKKKRRKDENALLSFLLFTAFHFALYASFTFIRAGNPGNSILVRSFYTAFYIANNVEVFLLFLYMRRYVELSDKLRKALDILNISLFLVFVFLDVLNAFVPMFFKVEGGEMIRLKTMFISQIYQFVMLASIFFVALTRRGLQIRAKVAFILYCLLPFVAIVLQNVFKGYAIAYLSIIVATEVLFFFLNVEKNFQLAREEEKAKEAQIRVMLSQIQPHFIYNVLSSISTLIPIDPVKAQEGLDNFTEYLRANLSSLTAERLIPFEDELRHIKTFLSLEKMRFGERLHIIYDIETTDFLVPPLSVQPLVENAVRHGVLKKVEGGTVILRVREEEDHHLIEVIDDGIGFDMNGVDFSNNEHVGLSNIRYRLTQMGMGDLSIKTKAGEGTRIAISLPKEGGYPS